MIEPRKQINNIYGYVRVSTVQQAKDGSSLEDQQKKIEEFVQAKFNRPVDKFFIDAGVSGAKPLTERPASRELTDVMDEHDIIVATKLDRFARSVKEMLTIIPILEETGITLYFSELFGDMPVVMPKNPEEVGLKKKFNMARQMSEMVISMMASFAEMEKEMILERTSSGKIAWAEKGYSIGGEAPFGYTKEYEEIGSRRHTKLVPLPEEQEVLKTIYACKKRGLGWRRTAKQVQSLHPEHANFTPYKVGKILKRKYQGLPDSA